jgi:hypothetical protein
LVDWREVARDAPDDRADERRSPPPIPEGASGGFWGSASVYYGPALGTLYLAILLFAAIFYFLLRRQNRDA